VLKLVDEEKDLEAQQPLEATLGPILIVLSSWRGVRCRSDRGSSCEEEEADKGVEAAAPQVIEAQNVANFLAARRKQCPSHL
jgi:hypothetical protein